MQIIFTKLKRYLIPKKKKKIRRACAQQTSELIQHFKTNKQTKNISG